MKSSRSSSRNSVFTWKYTMFYGWWLVILALFLNSVTGTPAFGAIGVWIDSLESEFGWSRTQLSWAFSIGQLEGSLIGPIIGVLVDKFGSRKVVLGGVVLCGIGFGLLSLTQSLPMFYISYGILMMGASGGGWLPMMTVINNWFNKRRSMAMGFGSVGFSFGGFLMVPALAWLVMPENAGWRMASLGIAIFYLMIAVPVSKLIRNTPEESGEIPDGREYIQKKIDSENSEIDQSNELDQIDLGIGQILKTSSFWVISISHACSTMLIGTMTVHFILALRDQGIPVNIGAWVWGFTLLFSGVAQIFGGIIGDKVPKNIALCIFGCIQASGVVFSTFITSIFWTPIFVLVYGLGFGARIPMGTAIRGEYFGRKSFGKVLGLSMAPMSIMMMIGPLVAGRMYDITGSYDLAFYILSGVAILGSLGFLFAKKPDFKS